MRVTERGRQLVAKWAVDLVESRFGVEPGSVAARGRGSVRLTTARQVACYLLTLRVGLTQAEAGRLLCRHSATVAHSLRRVEDMREDPHLNAEMVRLEETIDTLKGVLA